MWTGSRPGKGRYCGWENTLKCGPEVGLAKEDTVGG